MRTDPGVRVNECNGDLSTVSRSPWLGSVKWANVRCAATWRVDTIIAAILFWLSPFIVFFFNCELADAVETQTEASQFVAVAGQ